jgi:large subunit ribosomal protein L3
MWKSRSEAFEDVMTGLIGKKLGMTQVFAPDGTVVPVTVLDVSPSTVLQVKTVTRDGYQALQLGYGGTRLHRVSRANRARAERAGLEKAPLRVREFRTSGADRFEVGDVVGVDFFRPGDRVKVTGTSKGRGFSGVMKRYGFGGGTRKSHGGDLPIGGPVRSAPAPIPAEP